MKDKNITQQIAQSDFFNQYGQELKSIALNSKFQQDKARQLKKIEALRNRKEAQLSPSQKKLLDNIVIDYLRSFNLNYSYSIVMRERNLISEEIKTKQQLVDFFHLNDIFHSTSKFDISVLEMMMIRHSQILSSKKETQQNGVQVELISKDKTVNNQLLNEIRIAEARKEAEYNEKKHYLELLSTLKKQLTITLGDDLKGEYEVKMKTMKNQYEKQVQVLRQKNKEFLVNSPKLNPKIEEYLFKIEKLQNTNLDLSTKVKELEKDKITHNCFNNEKIVQRDNQIKKERKELQQKKNQYDLALKSIQTSVEDLVTKKAKLHEQPKQTDLFMAELKKNKNSKDHMIEQIYGRMFVMDKRIQSIAKDNESLMEENRQLLCKVKQLQTQRENLLQKQRQSSILQEKMNKYKIKPKNKDVLMGVTEEDLKQAFTNKKQHVIDDSVSGLDSDEEEQGLKNKQKYKNEVQIITSEMRLLKNRLRFMVEDFQ